MLLTRVITAVVLLLILVAAAYAGDHVLNAVLAIGYGITLAEWLKLTKLSGAASYLLGAAFAVAGAALALAAPDANVFGSLPLPACGLLLRPFATTPAIAASVCRALLRRFLPSRSQRLHGWPSGSSCDWAAGRF